MPRRLLSGIVASALLLATAGCVDLSAVSGFTKLGSSITENTAAVDSYPDAVKYAAQFNPELQAKERLAAELPAADTQTKSADLGMKTLSLYLSTVSSLADDKTVDVSASTTSIGNSLKGLGVLKTATQKPATDLITLLAGGALDLWRRQAVANLIVKANPSVQELCAALAQFARLTAERYQIDAHEVATYYGNLGLHQTPAVQEMLGEWRDEHVAGFTKASAAATAAAKAFTVIAQGHAALVAHAGELSSKELRAIIAKYQDQLSSAARLIIRAL
ncbi:MAG: hypothetical protein ACREFP_09910 [Acetobacteraceae bacterium]